MYIKCCGFKESKSTKAAVDNKVDAIGFITYPKSKRFVSVENLQILANNIPDEVDKVAVVVNPTSQEINDLVEQTSINTIQFHGDESIEFIKDTKRQYPQIKIFKAIPADQNLLENIQMYSEYVDLFLIDTPSKQYGGTGVSFDWSMLESIKDMPYLIAGGLDLEKIKHIETLDLNNTGYDISSGIESNGMKDITKIKTLLKELKG